MKVPKLNLAEKIDLGARWCVRQIFKGFGFLGFAIGWIFWKIIILPHKALWNGAMNKWNYTWKGDERQFKFRSYRIGRLSIVPLAAVCWTLLSYEAYVIGTNVYYLAAQKMEFPSQAYVVRKQVGPLISASTVRGKVNELIVEGETVPAHWLNPEFTDPRLAEASKAKRAATLSRALVYQLERELNSPMGWVPNDLSLAPQGWFDNTAWRQRGVIYATRAMSIKMSLTMTRMGQSSQEDPRFAKARERDFVISADKWGVMWIPSAEGHYRSGIKLVKQYANLLEMDSNNDGEPDAVQNLTSSDIFDLLEFITSDQFLEKARSEVSPTGDPFAFTELDNHVYFAQGVALVARDLLNVLLAGYSEDLNRGAALENFAQALEDFDKIAMFNPVVVFRGAGDGRVFESLPFPRFPDDRSKITRYYTNAMGRVEDVKKAMRR